MAAKVILAAAIHDVPPEIQQALHKKHQAERDALFQSQRQLTLTSRGPHGGASASAGDGAPTATAPEAPMVTPQPTPEEMAERLMVGR